MYYQVVDSSNDNKNDELTYEAAQLTRSLKKILVVCGYNFGIPVIVFCYSVYIHSLVVSGLVESHIYRQDR